MPPENTLTYASLCASILQKPCFAGPAGNAYQTIVGQAMDEQLDRLYYSKMCQWPSETPTDALFYLANERGLERVVLIGSGGTQENELLHRERLRKAWTVWAISGSQQGHRDELGWCGLSAVQVLRRVDFSTPPPVGSAYVRAFALQVWSQFDILIRPPMDVEPLIWGSGWLWGEATWGSTLTTAEIEELRRLVRAHKSAHNTCTYFWLQFAPGGPLWGTFRWGDGTAYGGSGVGVTGLVCGEESWVTRGYL